MRRLRHLLETSALAAVAVLVRALPRSAALALGAAIGHLGWSLRLRRELVLDNLRQALPETEERERRAIGRAAAANFGRTGVEFLRFRGGDRRRLDRLVGVEGVELLAERLGEGRGAIVVTGHLGSWALYVTALADRGVPAALLVGKQSNAAVDRFILAIPGDTVRFVSKGRSAPRHLLECLAEGRAVVMVADHYASAESLWVPFLGRAASTLHLPGAMAVRRSLPLFLMTGHRTPGGTHRVVLRQLPVPPEGTREERERAVAETFNAALGREILGHPEQYFWYHRRWKRRPRTAGPHHPLSEEEIA